VLLDPGQLEQRSQVFTNDCPSPDEGWGYANAYVLSGAGLQISASVIGSNTNDATTMVVQRE